MSQITVVDIQVVFKNLATGVDYICPLEMRWPIIPRIGEDVLFTTEDESVHFEGIVESISWSVGNDGDNAAVFVEIRPSVKV